MREVPFRRREDVIEIEFGSGSHSLRQVLVEHARMLKYVRSAADGGGISSGAEGEPHGEAHRWVFPPARRIGSTSRSESGNLTNPCAA